MKHRLVTLAVLLCVCLGAIGFAAWAQQHSADAREQESKVQQTAGNANNYEYLLKEYEGRLAVYKKNSTEPDMVFDLLIKMLPEYDRSMLQRGIYMETYEDAQRMVEDYTS